MASYIESAKLITEGQASEFYQTIATIAATDLDEYAMAVMALICEKAKVDLEQVRNYTFYVINAQALMPSGKIRSRQILACMAATVFTTEV